MGEEREEGKKDCLEFKDHEITFANPLFIRTVLESPFTPTVKSSSLKRDF